LHGYRHLKRRTLDPDPHSQAQKNQGVGLGDLASCASKACLPVIDPRALPARLSTQQSKYSCALLHKRKDAAAVLSVLPSDQALNLADGMGGGATGISL
jgi:hypothetical protein